jgi:ubiquinone/menaquinone biosynthesis C-methylase UbiE
MVEMRSKSPSNVNSISKLAKTKQYRDLHFIEEKFMISPIKKLMFNFFEIQVFKRLLRPLNIEIERKKILEAGCGAGYGIETISKMFSPKEYYAFDLNENMVKKSYRRIKENNLPVKVFQGNITKLPFKSSRFDVVLIFTVLHHVPRWRQALGEVHRVLKSNGIVLINEINQRSLDRFERYAKIYHPKAARFSWKEFRRELLKTGFQIRNEYYFLQDFGFFVGSKI